MAFAASNAFFHDAYVPVCVLLQQPQHIIFDRTLLSSILNSFSKEDINELTFLISPSLPTEKASILWSLLAENTVTMDSRAIIHPNDVIVDLFMVGDTTVNGILLIEALYYMKKFKVLKKLCYCKHQVKHYLDSREGRISKFWSFMYSILQDMDDAELFRLIHHLISDSRNLWSGFNKSDCDKWTPEQFFWQLYNNKIFTENNLRLFHGPLQMINREDIKLRMTNYEASCLCYPIRSTNPYGIAIIINQVDFETHKPPGSIHIENRIGSNEDKRSLIEVLEKFGFDVKEPYNDLFAEEIFQLAFDLKEQDFSQYDVFMCCILSHGRSGAIMGVDHQPVALAEFFEIFASSSNLREIPKIFLVQACQIKLKEDDNGEPNLRSSENVMQDGPGVPHLLPTGFGDMLCAISTIDGYLSYRSSSGSPFIQSFVSNLKSYGSTEDLDTILKKVNNDVSCNPKCPPQLPRYESTLRHKVQLRLAE